MKKILIRVVLLAVVLGGGYYGWTRLQATMAERQQSIATTKVRKGDVIVRSYARGELRPVRAVTLTAPNLFGTVQVTRLASLGAFAREKDLIVEFDDAEVQARIEEKQLELDQVGEQMKKAQADLAIRNNQDQVELLRARYSVRRAELEVKRNELISAIDAKKNSLSLEEARRRLQQLESDIKSRQEQAQAELAVLGEKTNKARLEMARERTRLNQVKILSPMTGLVAVKQNRSSVMMFGMTPPDIREGDQVQPGMPVADVLDLSEMEVLAKVGELDRANLKDGQDVVIRLDAIPEKQFTGKIKSMSGTASTNIFSSDPAKKFDVIFSIDMRQLLSALGAKPDQVARVLATAEANRRKPAIPSAGLFGGMPGGMRIAGGAPGGAPGGDGNMMTMPAPGMGAMAGGAAGVQGGGGQRQGGGGTGMTSEQQTKMREAMQKALKGRSMQDLTAEERAEIVAGLRKDMEKTAGGATKKGEVKDGDAATAAAPRREGGGGEGGGGEGGGGEGGGREAGGSEGGERRRARGEGGMRGGAGMPGGGGGAGGFSAQEMANAKLPPPPEEETQLDVLLRPGLLADVEIIVEKVADAIHIPGQSVFEKDGKQIVYVRNENKFEERVVKPLKRSETTLIISSGLKPGEVIALADPNARPDDKKKSGAGDAASSLPGAKGSK